MIAIATRRPVNKLAAMVTSKSVAYKSLFENKSHVFEAEIRPEVRQISTDVRQAPGFYDFTGERIGRFVVIGMSKKRPRWVVRCDCGKYVERKTSVLKKFKTDASRAMCQYCDYHDQNIRGKRYEHRIG